MNNVHLLISWWGHPQRSNCSFRKRHFYPKLWMNIPERFIGAGKFTTDIIRDFITLCTFNQPIILTGGDHS